MSSVPRVHQGLAFLLLTLGVVQFFLAGLAVFGESIDPHRIVGNLTTLVGLVLLVLAFVGRREALFQSAVLFGLLLLQVVLALVGRDVSVLGALHPVNGLLVLVVAHQAARALPLPFGPRGTATRPVV